jgi:drug/metabolite transporter (DMT)-like permease
VTQEKSNGRPRYWIAIGLTVAIVLDTVGQLLWKHAAIGLPQSLSPALLLGSFVRSPLPIIIVLGVFFLQLINWLVVLERVELSYAQPLTSLSYVSVVMLSVWLFGERLESAKLLGVLLVLAGVAMIGVDAMRREPTQ